jgi:hypothetical protein
LLACLAFWPSTPLDSHHLAGCACGDPEQQTWFLAWTPFALTHGLNPFTTSYLHVPTGANLAIDTAMPLLGVIGLPVTALAGPVATYNLLLRLGLAASALSMFLVLRRYTRRWPAAFAGGLLFGFSSYMVGQAHRHLFLAFVPLVPLFIPLLDDWLVRPRRSALRSGLLVGLVAGLQYLISPEIVLTSAMFAAVALAFLALRHRAVARQRLRVLGRGLMAAVPVCALIAGYPVWLLLAGPNRPAGPPHTLADLARYHGDLLATVVPTSNDLLAPGGLSRIGSHLLPGANVENGFYLGALLLGLLFYLAVRCRRSPIVAVSVVVGLTAFVLSLGGKLTANGHVLLAPLPFALLQHLPVVQDLEAARLSLFVQLAAAVVLGVGLDLVATEGWRARPAAASGGAHGGADRGGAAERWAGWPAHPFAVAAVGLVALAPLLPSLPFRSAPADVPAFFTGPAVRAVPAGAVALTFPFDRAPRNEPMLWQAVAGLRFRILGGDAFVPAADGASTWQPDPPGPPVISAILLAGTSRQPGPPPGGDAQTLAAVRLFCASNRIGAVFVQPAARYGRQVAQIISAALRRPPAAVGQLEVWLNVQRDLHVQRDLRPGPG